MVIKKYIRSLTGTILFLVLLFCFSCEDLEPLIINCAECYTNEPYEAEIKIRLEEAARQGGTIVKIYEGYLEDSLLYKTLYTNSESISTKVALNKMYTAAAIYIIDGNYYTAVNTFNPRVKYDEEQCVDPCYYVYDKNVNMKLKYTK